MKLDGTQVNQCPKYSCVLLPTSPPPAPLDEVYIEDKCTMTGRLFETFDGAEYSYDICNHVLARDTNGSWSVTGAVDSMKFHNSADCDMPFVAILRNLLNFKLNLNLK